MEENFKFIWIYALQIVKYYLDKGDEFEAYQTYDKAAQLVSDHYSGAYRDSVAILGPERMETIWKLDSLLAEKDSPSLGE